MRGTERSPRFFRTPDELRRWLVKNGESADEVWIGFHRQRSGRAGITYKQALDEALCFGWIDGVRKGVDEGRYEIRFTPRRARSIWSLVNTARMKELIAAGRVTPRGHEAWAARDPARSGVYSFERETAELGPEFERLFRANAKAWDFFQSRPPWYRRTSTFWVVSAKKEETRRRRLEILIAQCARQEPIRELDRRPATGRGDRSKV